MTSIASPLKSMFYDVLELVGLLGRSVAGDVAPPLHEDDGAP